MDGTGSGQLRTVVFRRSNIDSRRRHSLGIRTDSFRLWIYSVSTASSGTLLGSSSSSSPLALGAVISTSPLVADGGATGGGRAGMGVTEAIVRVVRYVVEI